MISFSTGSLYHLEIERIFKIAKDAGFEYLELMLRGRDEAINKKSWDAKYLKNLQNTYQIKIASAHSPIDFELCPNNEYFEKAINISKALDVKYLIMHIPKIKDKYKAYQIWFGGFEDNINNQEVTVLIENLGKNESYCNAKQFSKFTNFCFDATHALKENVDPIEIIKNMKNIRQLHLGYFDGEKDHLKPTLNKDLFEKIIRLQPDANLCLELKPHSFNSPGDDQKIIEELKIELEFLKFCTN